MAAVVATLSMATAPRAMPQVVLLAVGIGGLDERRDEAAGIVHGKPPAHVGGRGVDT
jgi:hypothetical protein